MGREWNCIQTFPFGLFSPLSVLSLRLDFQFKSFPVFLEKLIVGERLGRCASSLWSWSLVRITERYHLQDFSEGVLFKQSHSPCHHLNWSINKLSLKFQCLIVLFEHGSLEKKKSCCCLHLAKPFYSVPDKKQIGYNA